MAGVVAAWPTVALGEVIRQRKEFIQIDDTAEYKRCRVQLHAQGIVLRDIVAGAEIKTKSQQVCHAEEFLVAEIDAKVGGFGIVPEALEGAIVSSHYFLFTVDDSRLDRRFLDYFIRTHDFQEQVTAQGSTNYAAIRPADVLGYTIPLPPLDEQRRIVARIEELAARIEQARRLRREAMAESEALWQSILAGAFMPRGDEPVTQTAAELLNQQALKYAKSDRLTYNGAHPWEPSIYQEGLYPIPASWRWTDLGSVLAHFVDCVNDTPDFILVATGLLGLKSTNIRPYRLDLTERWFVTPDDYSRWNRREEPQPGDLILTREAPVGNVCILPDGVKVCLTQRLMLLRTDDDFINSRYLLHFLNSPHFQSQVREQCRGLTTPHIRVKDAPFFKVPLPPRHVQDSIVAYLDNEQAKTISAKQLQAETAAELNALLPSVLDKAFRGEL